MNLFLLKFSVNDFMESIPFQIILLFILIMINAFFAMSEIAIITLNDNKIKNMSKTGHKGAIKVLSVTKNSSQFLATIQVGVTLSGFLTSASASTLFSEKLASALSFLPLSKNLLNVISTVIITIILSYFSLVLGELVPKKIAMQNAEKISFKVIGIIDTFQKIFNPFVKLLSSSTNFVVRLFGIDPNLNEEVVTEEEILMMIDAGKEKGVIEESIKNMIENIFDFDDKTANEIMTHRTDIIAIQDIESLSKAINLATIYGFSRIPVFKSDIDDIIGMIYVKDLLKYIDDSIDKSKVRLTDIMRNVIYIPSTKRCSELFKELTDKKTQIAIIVDEYGGTEGLITIEDLMESIVGNIQDEYDNEDEEITKISDNSFTVDGMTSIDEVSNLLHIKIPDGDYDTIAGFMVKHLGYIPKKGEHPYIDFKNVRLIVSSVEDRRISKISISIKDEESKSKDKN